MHVAGFAGCNQMGGRYTMDGNTLRFIQIYTTRMACADGMDLEQQYLAALDGTREFRLEGNRLRLIGVAGVLAEFDTRN
jgi:heat shock protein HslJ